MVTLLLFRGGVVLTFTGEDLDVVTQPIFEYTDTVRYVMTVRQSTEWK